MFGFVDVWLTGCLLVGVVVIFGLFVCYCCFGVLFCILLLM